jgi:hypothetical protein
MASTVDSTTLLAELLDDGGGDHFQHPAEAVAAHSVS